MDMFVSNLAVFTEALGVENAPTIMEMSLIPWPDEMTRDQFIKRFDRLQHDEEPVVADNEALRQQRERASRASSREELRQSLGIANLTTNPLIGLDPFEAESYLPFAPEKSYEKPVKSPRYVDPRMDSPISSCSGSR